MIYKNHGQLFENNANRVFNIKTINKYLDIDLIRYENFINA